MLPRYVKDITCSTSVLLIVNTRSVLGLTFISLVSNSFVLSPTFAASSSYFSNFAFILLHLCASTQMSSAKSRSSDLFIILHCTPFFLPSMTVRDIVQQEIWLEIIHNPVWCLLLLGRSRSAFLRVSHDIWMLHIGLWSCLQSSFIIIIISCYPFRDIGRQQNVAIWSYFWPAA